MNKYQEALNYLSDHCLIDEGDYDYEDNYETWYTSSGSEETKVLQELIDKEEKYRWHDLRENPNDLPKTRTPINVWLGGGLYYAGSWIGDNVFVIDGEGDMTTEEVIAWKYIEEFNNKQI